ncbi:MAG: hypothetical protein ACYSSI_02550 [Planctomycetota bacterium]|jgi:hypothetical protein
MAKTRLPKLTSEKEIWKNIHKKLDPQTLKVIKQLLPIINNFFRSFEKRFRLNRNALKIIEKGNIPDWSNYYTDSPFLSLLSLLLSTLGFQGELPISTEKIPRSTDIIRLIDGIKNIKVDNEKIESLIIENALKFIYLYRAGLIDAVCILTYKRHMNQLIEIAKSDDSALFKAIYMDKGLAGTDWVIKRIRKASLEADMKFFRNLSKALKTPIDSNKTSSGFKLTLALYVLCGLSLYKLTDKELAVIIKKYGIYTIKDEGTLRTFRNRLGLKKYTTEKINL